MRRLQPGRIVRQDDGSLLAPDFGDTYASRAGALAQSRAVFLAGCDLPQRLSGRSHTVLETGFGTGLNALTLAQLQAGASGAATACHIHYVGI
ncbi:MAG: bifunctional tRNA (5-methylaminomethyl-2-thiouridine)(34)-methyltransferase MnmD/FAD-dependent 5-carboxymethylaminomethyl-2-thiouridine(34) oxidoreductase MnmC, partial [Betaproteobacteria bacterium]|nr:bifunctional tRNA (5-methylaminomethyl-2-thiouridine)(34)-methyltransferase MnmD/FAD-dependent 5-carboxymethylaminomethyl-2-thiouridine(34) oxidoreductase MnmC [Betaproteobacteria bacterium]